MLRSSHDPELLDHPALARWCSDGIGRARGGWLAHEACSISGEMLVSLAGRVARAYIAETPGVYRASWTIDQVDEHLASPPSATPTTL
jgi:hypothetical protein